MKPVGLRAPNLNAFVAFYHDFRPHQGTNNRLIGNDKNDGLLPIESVEQVRCESRLGGLLKFYSRAA